MNRTTIARDGTIDPPLTPYTLVLVGICIFIAMVDGYDVQAMSLAVPFLAKTWALTKYTSGVLLTASLVGQVFGAVFLGQLGDRLGRKPVLVAGLATSGIAAFAAAHTDAYLQMAIVRVIAGVGLGVVQANIMPLALELSPRKWRAMIVVLVVAGYPLGASAGAAIAGALLASHSVSIVFYLSAFGAAAALIACLTLLPGARDARSGWLRGVIGLRPRGAHVAAGHDSQHQHPHGLRSQVAMVFSDHRRAATLLLWCLNFMSMMMVYFFIMWLPSVLVQLGVNPLESVRYMAVFSLSGVFGGVALAIILPRAGPARALTACYVAAILGIVSLSLTSSSSVAFYPSLVLCGATIVGSQFCIVATINLFYPAEVRATGLGLALGVGRLGAVLAPLIGGTLLALLASPRLTLITTIAPILISVAALYALRKVKLSALSS